ncbi:GGDEF domain-containing protein [Glaciecola sp. SC05]|uniref:GGDEF domain-containing protein n=1 Tax=Glaciecola sp. SC05 TaxID=1987355 RepID=UPI0035277750
MMTDVRVQTQSKANDIVFRQTKIEIIGSILAASIIVLWLYPVADFSSIAIWYSVFFVVLLALWPLSVFYAKYKTTKSPRYWSNIIVAMRFTTGCTYAAGLITLFPIGIPEYLVSLVLFIVVLSAGAMVSFITSFRSIICFFLPIFVVPSLYIIIGGGRSGIVLGIGTLLYGLVIITLTRSINQAFMRSISLNIENQIEIKKRKAVELALQKLTQRDALTGLYNRGYFNETLISEISRANRQDLPLALIMIDIDCFKQYNDQYGHVLGDECLIIVAQLIKQVFSRQSDFVARYGGEEFAVILPDTNVHSAMALCHSLVNKLQQQEIAHDATNVSGVSRVTLSIGLASCGVNKSPKYTAFINQADSAMYRAKKQGRNQICLHDKEDNLSYLT